MASPRAAVSVVKCFSPKKLPNVSTIRQTLSPSKFGTNLTVESTLQNKPLSPIFNIDTPHKKKIVTEGILGKYRTVLGNGGFGTVYKASYKGKEVAAKVIKNNKNKDSSISMEKEASFLSHENIVNILKVDEGPALTLITMELCGNSLQNILEENPISKKQKIHVWESIARALKYCHKMGIVHADVKPKNVLMSKDNHPKLADFGCAVFMNRSFNPLVFHGTPGYVAPEVICRNVPTPLSDIYSLGILAWQMLSRKPPFSGLHKHTILYLTGKGVTPSDHSLNDDFEGKYKDLYRKSWSKKPEERPNLIEIIKQLKKFEIENI